MNPNFFAYIALFGWPFFVSHLFKRYPLNKAIILSILLGYLFLPVGLDVDFPLIPPLNKESIPSLAVFFVIRYGLGKRVPLYSKFDFFSFLVILFLVSPIFTVLSNFDPVYTGANVIPGLSIRDIVSVLIRQWIVLIPLLVGRQFLKEPKDLELVLKLIVSIGLVYSLFELFEVRMSPQLHRWTYGYHTAGFGQQKRGGGFRPTVFLGHGLWVAFYTMISVISATLLWRLKKTAVTFVSNKQVVFYLFIVLVFCKTLGSLIYAMAIVPLIYWGSVNLQVRVIKILTFICILYPLLRIYEYFPITMLLDWAYSYDAERGQSLQYRFDQENALLARAQEKLFSGWGGWGRNRIYDLETGNDISITDGHWIIVLGIYGLIGFIAEFGIFLYSVYHAVSVVQKIKDSKEKVLLASFSLILLIYVVDLLPNDPLSPLTWLIAGALYGNVEYQKKLINKRLL